MEKETLDIRKLQEIFGITITEASNTYYYYKKDLNDAIQGLTSRIDSGAFSIDSGIKLGPENRNDGDGSSSGDKASPANSGSGTSNNPIDLTTQDDDLQKALALSIQEMQKQQGGGMVQESTNISLEDQELSRALEASLVDNQGNMDRLGMSHMSYDPLNPHERKRSGEIPVGFKNIGNTCWFSSVIQSLYNIPVFKEYIINYHPPEASAELPQCVMFVIELQKLFALLIKTNQKYINPKPAIDLLQPVFNHTPGTQQQDVSEFTHKLLEWIEDAFSYSQNKDQPNPIIELFTGQCMTEGFLNGEPFVNHSQFGAFPVQVEGHTHLHDSLEAATVNNEMQQETWFTRLPPILVVELSRFKYNQTTGQAEKIHDQLSFDQILYMDRYLNNNCEEIRQRRKEVYKLREKVQQLESKLRSYTDYNEKNISIQEVLSLALKFVGNVCHDQSKSVQVMETGPAPRSGTESEVGVTFQCLRQWMSEMEAEMSEIQESLKATLSTLNSVYSDPDMKQTAYRLHAVLVHQGQASRGHYWAYVRKTESKGVEEKDMDVLETSQEIMQQDETEQKSREQTEKTEKDNELPDLGKDEKKSDMDVDLNIAEIEAAGIHSPSILGTPLSENANSLEPNHDGDPISGCVDHSKAEVWIKFNDVSVTEVHWDEIERESFGGSRLNNGNTSAYCLVYISTDTERQWEERQVSSEHLSDALIKYVTESNQSFEKQLEEYDLKKQKMEQSQGNELIKTAKLVRFASPKQMSPNAQEMQAIASDAKRARAGSPNLEDMQIETEDLPPVEIDPLVLTQLQARLTRKLRLLSMELPESVTESRLLSEFHYASQCGSSDKVRQAILLQQVINELDKEDNITLSVLARKELFSITKLTNLSDELHLFRKLYSLFCGVCHHCLQAVNFVKKDDWCRALSHVVKSYANNYEICKLSNEMFALRPQLLGAFRSKVLLEVSSLGTVSFNAGEVSTALDIANNLIVPVLKEFACCPSSEDTVIVEKIRAEWCQCLDQNTLPEDDADKLADLLMKIVEDFSKSSSLVLPETPQNLDTQLLAAQFSNAFKFLCTSILPNPDSILSDYQV